MLAGNSRLPRGHYLAGLISLHGDDPQMAEQAFATTVQLNERHAGAWAQLARIYLRSGEFVKAEGCLENAVATVGRNANTCDLIGTCFRLAGNLAASLQWHERTVAAAPKHAPFRLNLANACLYTGDTGEARRHVETVLETEPDNALAHWLLSRAQTATSSAHIEAMTGALARVGDVRARAHLQFAIGKECEDLQRWDDAYVAYNAANAARRTLVDYDEQAEIELFEAIDSLFTRDWLEARQSDCYANAPIFIIGQPRTGTTLLDRMLDAHPVVHSAGELRHFGFAVRRATGCHELRQFSAELLRRAADADVTAIGEAYIASTAGLRGDAAHIVDKLPSNFYYLPLILASLPNASVIHVTREPMDTCFAVFKQSFAGAYLHSYDQQEMARHFVRYHRLMDTMRTRFPGRFIDVAYEALVSDSEGTLRTVLEHVGLSWHPECLEFTYRDAAVATQSAAQVREAPHRRSIGRWRRYETQLAPMRQILEGAGIVPADSAQ